VDGFWVRANQSARRLFRLLHESSRGSGYAKKGLRARRSGLLLVAPYRARIRETAELNFFPGRLVFISLFDPLCMQGRLGAKSGVWELVCDPHTISTSSWPAQAMMMTRGSSVAVHGAERTRRGLAGGTHRGLASPTAAPALLLLQATYIYWLQPAR
jgi:hypothetical protein